MRWWMLGMLAVATPAMAQPARCTDDNGRDRCTTEAQRVQNAHYGVPAIDDPALRGTRMMRVFYVDGYGQDIGMVTFVRPPGDDPRVEWRGRRARDGAVAPPSMTAILPIATWDRIVAEGRGFDRDYAPPPVVAGSSALPPPICLHSWVVRVEAIDADGTIRRRTQDTCDEAPAVRHGFGLAAMAVDTLPFCALLDREKTRNDVTRLAECSMLSGDRAAAAQAGNRFRTTWFENPRGPDFARALQYLFTENAEIAWPGIGTATGGEAAARLWTTHAGDSRFLVRRFVGETPDRVRIEGEIHDLGRSDGTRRQLPATMIWVRSGGEDFRLSRLTAG